MPLKTITKSYILSGLMMHDAFYLANVKELNIQQLCGIVLHYFKPFLKQEATFEQVKQACKDKLTLFRGSAKVLDMRFEPESREYLYSLVKN